MGDTIPSTSMHHLRRPTLRIRRCGLYAPAGRILDSSSFELEFPSDSPILVVGPNGSGKSLATSAIRYALGPESGDDLRADLLAAGIEQIEVDIECGSLAGQVRASLGTAERLMYWTPPEGSTNGNHLAEAALRNREDGTWASVFATHAGVEVYTQICLVCNGEVQVTLNDELLLRLRDEALEPLARELRNWTLRLHDLAGESGDAGRLGQAREELHSSQERIRFVEEVQRKLEQARQLQSDLQAQLERLLSQHAMVKAELEQCLKVSTLADRARRVHAWLDEIKREYDDVAWLREQHEKYQQRLDELENIFRGAPDHLDEVLAAYQGAKQEENAIVEKLHLTRLQRAQLEGAIAAARGEFETCTPPAADATAADTHRWRTEIAQAEAALTELLRGRVELIRQREGLRLQLQREFATFLQLSGEAREKLEEYFAWEEQSDERNREREGALSETRRQHERRMQQLRSELAESFAGFENLPGNAFESVRELFDRRKLALTLQQDREELDRKRAVLESRDKESRKHLWTLLAGLIGAILGGILGGWDVALFFGLAASGIMMLAGKFLYGDVERQLDAALQTAKEVEVRRQDSLEIAARLQTALAPLASSATLEEALERLERHRLLARELEQLTATQPGELTADTGAGRELRDDFAKFLPAKLLELPVETAETQYADFLEIERSLGNLDAVWNEYEDGGAKAVASRELEASIARMREELERHTATAERQKQAYEARRRELGDQLAALESSRAVGPSVEQVEAELTRVRAEVDRLLTESAGFLERMEGEALSEQTHMLRDLRTEIRKVRDSLSSRQSLDELRAREALLSEELEEVKQKLSGLDPLYLLDGTVADYAAKYNRQLESAGQALSVTESELDMVQRDLDVVEVDHWTRTLMDCDTLDTLHERESAARECLERVERDTAAARDTVHQLQAEYDENFRSHRDDVLAALSDRIRSLSDGHFLGLQMADGKVTVALANGGVRSLGALSAGMRDLVWLAARLELIVQDSDSPLMPVFWDEPFIRLDDHFLERLRVELAALARDRQVVVLTRDARLAEWGALVRLPAVVRQPDMAPV